MVKEGTTVGVINLADAAPQAFSPRQVEILETLAAQAVIAISNARLFEEVQQRTAELTEALEQQKASAEILGVISRSVADTQPVFEKILDSCRKLFGGEEVDVLLIDENGFLRVEAYLGKFEKELLETFPAPWEITPAGEAIRTGQVAHYADCTNNPDTPRVLQKMAQIASYHSVAFAPMMWEGKGIGVIGVARSARPFTDRELRIMQGFADQAVIAIQSARLFRETNEALERQTATAEVLEVINNSVEDAKPVFDKILDSCQKLIPCRDLSVMTINADGLVHLGAVRGPTTLIVTSRYTPVPVGRTVYQLAVESRKLVHCPSALNGPHTSENLRRMAAKVGDFSSIFVPMVWKGDVVGALFIARGHDEDLAPAFTRREMDIVESFADQAVIAIQNARMFGETQAALARQTATADVLRVISASPTDVKPVFDAIASTALRLLECDVTGILIRQGDTFTLSAGAITDGRVFEPSGRQSPIEPDKNYPSQVFSTGEMVYVPDASQVDLPEHEVEAFSKFEMQTAIFMPLLRNGECVGVLTFVRKIARPFTDAQIELAKSFCDQAGIAIENVRLFNDTQSALARQTASADILRVISASPNDVLPVFEEIVRVAVRLVKCDLVVTMMREGDVLNQVAVATPDGLQMNPQKVSIPIDPEQNFPSRVLLENRALHIEDYLEFDLPPFEAVIQQRVGVRSLLSIPLVRGEQRTGLMAFIRKDRRPFTYEEIDLAQSFADQAMIAIENVRLFRETQAARAAVEKANAAKSAFLATMSHEIRTP
jgi:GAF domain-containing protein